jgi:GTPase SAR1 family protein
MASRTAAKPEEYYIVVLGMGGVGKTSFITQVPAYYLAEQPVAGFHAACIS